MKDKDNREDTKKNTKVNLKYTLKEKKFSKKITTIKIEKGTKDRLERLKEHNRETYNEVIKKILYILNHIRKDPVSANRILSKIDANIRRKENFSGKK